MTRKIATRAEDEIVLRLLARRGHMSAAAAGAPFGLSPEAVRVAIFRVVKADRAESGEAVDPFYFFHQ